MKDVAKGGRTVLFVSHNMAAVEGLCSKGVLLENGRLVATGEAKEVINTYLSNVLPLTLTEKSLQQRNDRKGTQDIRIVDFWVEDKYGKKVNAVTSGSDCTLAIKYETQKKKAPSNIDVGISLNSPSGAHLIQFYSSYVDRIFNNISNNGIFMCHIPRLPLGPNRYTVVASIVSNGILMDYLNGGIGYLDVEAGDFYGTGRGIYHPNIPLLINGSWSVTNSK